MGFFLFLGGGGIYFYRYAKFGAWQTETDTTIEITKPK